MITQINKDFYIVSNVWNRGRQAWGHESTAYYKGFKVASKRITYQNRTWERYQFESCMACLVDILDKGKVVPLKDRIQAIKLIKNI